MWFGYSPGSPAGVGLLIAPQLSHHALKFAPVNQRVIFPAPSVRGQVSCSCLCLQQHRVPALLGVSERDRLIVLQMGTQLFYWGTSTPMWATTVITGGAIWWNDLPNLNPIVVFLLDFCASHTLFITNTMFTHKGVHQCIWHQDTLGRKLMIEFNFNSSVFWPYVWDTKRV